MRATTMTSTRSRSTRTTPPGSSTTSVARSCIDVRAPHLLESNRIESHRRIDPRLRFVVKDKYGDAASDDDDDESVEEDDDAVLMTKPIEDRFLTLLPLLRKRHESVYQAKTPFFPCTCCCHSLESALVLDAIIDTHDTDQHCCLVCAAYKETRELANLEVTLSTHSGCVRYDLQLASF